MQGEYYSFAPWSFAVAIQCSESVSGFAPIPRANCNATPIIKTEALCNSWIVCAVPNCCCAFDWSNSLCFQTNETGSSKSSDISGSIRLSIHSGPILAAKTSGGSLPILRHSGNVSVSPDSAGRYQGEVQKLYQLSFASGLNMHPGLFRTCRLPVLRGIRQLLNGAIRTLRGILRSKEIHFPHEYN